MKRTDVHVLVNSVNKVWKTRRLDAVIGKVWTRMNKVLSLLVEGKGGNDLVEKKRGKKFTGLDVPREFLDGDGTTTEATTTATSTEANSIIDLVEDDEEDDDDVELIMSSL